jgi:hypothetical protein
MRYKAKDCSKGKRERTKERSKQKDDGSMAAPIHHEGFCGSTVPILYFIELWRGEKREEMMGCKKKNINASIRIKTSTAVEHSKTFMVGDGE